MKWWYVVVLMVGVGLGWWLLDKYGVKTSTPVAVIKEGKIQTELLALPTQMYLDIATGKKIETVQISGLVRSWEPDTGTLEMSVGGKIWILTIDLAKTRMIVNSLKDKSSELVITDKNSLNWSRGFCEGDEVSVFLKGQGVVFVSNNGFRKCGYKGE